MKQENWIGFWMGANVSAGVNGVIDGHPWWLVTCSFCVAAMLLVIVLAGDEA